MRNASQAAQNYPTSLTVVPVLSNCGCACCMVIVSASLNLSCGDVLRHTAMDEFCDRAGWCVFLTEWHCACLEEQYRIACRWDCRPAILCNGAVVCNPLSYTPLVHVCMPVSLLTWLFTCFQPDTYSRQPSPDMVVVLCVIHRLISTCALANFSFPLQNFCSGCLLAKSAAEAASL